MAEVLPDAISEIEAGVVCAPDPVDSVPAPDTVAGTTHVIDVEPRFVSVTRVVPAALGVGFGVKSRSTDPAGLAPVTMVLTHPPMGPEKTVEQRFVTRISGQAASLTFYQFDYGYELVPGTWTFTAMQGDAALYSVAFEVVEPHMLPDLATACGYLNLLS